MFIDGLFEGEIRSTIHTKVGEQPDKLTIELAERFTWHNEDPVYLPRPLELRSVDAGKGWAQLDYHGKPVAVAILFEYPSIDTSGTEIFHRYTTHLVVKGTGFLNQGSIKAGRLGLPPGSAYPGLRPAHRSGNCRSLCQLGSRNHGLLPAHR
ncbi:unnamed protein product [Ectocarpus sp. 12 AP-2014]